MLANFPQDRGCNIVLSLDELFLITWSLNASTYDDIAVGAKFEPEDDIRESLLDVDFIYLTCTYMAIQNYSWFLYGRNTHLLKRVQSPQGEGFSLTEFTFPWLNTDSKTVTV